MSKKPVGQMPDGWQRQGLQVPEAVGEKFKMQASKAGVGGIKALGTAALALITEMPDEFRYALMRRAGNYTWPDPRELNPRDMWTMLVSLILQDAKLLDPKSEDVQDRVNWYIDKIMDPELTPEPGRKRSDGKRLTGEDRA